jgi:hypothetical protein
MSSSSTVTAGNVISESPLAGTSATVGSAVNLTVSTGPAHVSVPNVVGDTQAAATTAITGAGLVLGTVTMSSSSTVTAGEVISENPAANTSVVLGSAVNLVVSTGNGTGPASVQITVSAQIVAPNGNITVTPVALDGNGNVISPSPDFTINITAVGATTGNAPVVDGDTITFPKLNKRLLNQNTTLDPNGLFADTDPTDPNYGKQTGGVYQVTASIASPVLVSAPVQVVVIPSSSATITAETYSYASQLNGALSQIVSAYGNTGHSGITAAKTALQNVISNVNFSAAVLQANQVLAPPDGQLITPGMLTGFSSSPDDPAYTTTLATVISAVQNATAQVNALNTSSPTMAQVTAIQTATATYAAALAQLNALNPSAIELATVNAPFNELYSSDIPTLLDAIKNQVNAMAAPFSGELRKRNASPIFLARALARMHLAPQLFDIFALGFGAYADLGGQAMNNIVRLGISLANDLINMQLAGIINSSTPPGMSIDDIFTSDFSIISACFPGTEVDGFGFDPNPANDLTIVVGAVDSGVLADLITLSPPKGIGQSIALTNTIISDSQTISKTFDIVTLQTPDQFVFMGGILADGSDALIFNNGWPQVNQSALPAVGLVIVTNINAGTFAATNVSLIPGGGSCP